MRGATLGSGELPKVFALVTTPWLLASYLGANLAGTLLKGPLTSCMHCSCSVREWNPQMFCLLTFLGLSQVLPDGVPAARGGLPSWLVTDDHRGVKDLQLCAGHSPISTGKQGE